MESTYGHPNRSSGGYCYCPFAKQATMHNSSLPDNGISDDQDTVRSSPTRAGGTTTLGCALS